MNHYLITYASFDNDNTQTSMVEAYTEDEAKAEWEMFKDPVDDFLKIERA